MKIVKISLLILSFNALAFEEVNMDNFIKQQIEHAKQMLNQEFASAGSPTIKLAEKVIWPNKALGCPRDDVNYNQVLTDGIRIVLSVDGKDYIYHGDSKGKLFLCDPSKVSTIYRTGWQSAEY
ncbi:hypothetical protein [Neptunicella sp. SCSIO 80796]|uniref:hypothetical protein n=1 Tax=Neptunicella plasticusilytica TaxID=3117012 RepID=UPI003A4D2D71